MAIQASGKRSRCAVFLRWRASWRGQLCNPAGTAQHPGDDPERCIVLPKAALDRIHDWTILRFLHHEAGACGSAAVALCAVNASLSYRSSPWLGRGFLVGSRIDWVLSL